ncbi:MAG: hypothetical protein OHK0039_15270 [Bacteroidia bacterium]
MLHIFNGDSTRLSFLTQALPGATAVWNEVLCEGPCTLPVSDDSWVARRDAFFSAYFHLPPGEYAARFRQEWAEIQTWREHEEVVLWFEYDLFCQINLLGLLSYFDSQALGSTRLSLVCLGTWPGYEGLVALGEIDPVHYAALLDSRIPVSTADLRRAADCWACYCGPDHRPLAGLAADWPLMPYLPAAVQAHYRRFPSRQTGLTAIEARILDQIAAGHTDTPSLIGALLRDQQPYGFGDLQYLQYLRAMAPLIGERAPHRIPTVATNRGLASLVFGGCAQGAFVWDEAAHRLIPGQDAAR